MNNSENKAVNETPGVDETPEVTTAAEKVEESIASMAEGNGVSKTKIVKTMSDEVKKTLMREHQVSLTILEAILENITD